MGKKGFQDLFTELEPLVHYLSNTSDYRKLRFTPSDIVGFFNEKLYNVWLKYSNDLPYEEVKALAMSSLYHLRTKVYKKYSREVSLGEHEQVECIYEESPNNFIEEAKKYLNDDQAFVLELLVDPPLYIIEKIHMGKRIPSHLVLEYLDLEATKRTVKMMNTFRREIFQTLEVSVGNNA